jgi:hypothetical protein
MNVNVSFFNVKTYWNDSACFIAVYMGKFVLSYVLSSSVAGLGTA